MRSSTIIKLLLTLVVLLVATSLFTLDKALYYRANPQVKVEHRNSIVYGQFDPDRSQAYTCRTQEVINHVGMVCDSPDGNISINCTVATGDTNPSQYFC